MVVNEMVQGANTVAVDGTKQRSDVVIRSPNGSERIMTVDEFKKTFKPTHQPCDEPALARRGFETFQRKPDRPTSRVLAQRLTAELTSTFPVGKYDSSAHVGQWAVMPFPSGGSISMLGEDAFHAKYKADTTGLYSWRAVSQADMLRQWSAPLRREDVYTKTSQIHARRAIDDGFIETVIDRKVEARQPYRKGDCIVCGSRGAKYSMEKKVFSDRYDIGRTEPATDIALARAGFKLFNATGRVFAHKLTPAEVAAHFPHGRFYGKCACCNTRLMSCRVVDKMNVLLVAASQGGGWWRWRHRGGTGLSRRIRAVKKFTQSGVICSIKLTREMTSKIARRLKKSFSSNGQRC